MQSASKTDITRWLHENQYTYGNLAFKREGKPNRPRQSARNRLLASWPAERKRRNADAFITF